MADGSPYKRDGETVYATEPVEETTESDKFAEERYKDKEWLHYQYHTLGKSLTEIAETTPFKRNKIRYWVDKHDIKTRGKGGDAKHHLLKDKKWLQRQYHTEQNSLRDIASELDVDSETVRYWMEKHGIERRGRSDALRNVWGDKNGGKKYADKTWLEHQYIKLGLSSKDIADKCDCDRNTIINWVDKHGIQKRSAQVGTLLAYKREKCPPDENNRQLVTSDGIDATMRSIGERNQSCEIQYRNPKWLKSQIRKGRSMSEMSRKCKSECTPETIRRWLDRFGIEHPNSRSD